MTKTSPDCDATVREVLEEAERLMAYFAGETDRIFVGSGTPVSCLAKIRAALAASQPNRMGTTAEMLASEIAIAGHLRIENGRLLSPSEKSLVVAALAATPAVGEDGPCFYCGEQTCSVAGNPGRWPLVFCQPDGTGIERFHHTGCVTDRLFDATGSATPAVGGEALAWMANYDGHIDVTIYPDTARLWQEKFKRQITPLYAAQPASPLRGTREQIARVVCCPGGCILASCGDDACVALNPEHVMLTTADAILALASPPEQPAADPDKEAK